MQLKVVKYNLLYNIYLAKKSLKATEINDDACVSAEIIHNASAQEPPVKPAESAVQNADIHAVYGLFFKEKKDAKVLRGETFLPKALKIQNNAQLWSLCVIVSVREHVHGPALLFPALGPPVCGLRALREGQVGGDAVPDAVAQHAVVAAVSADQLSSAKDGKKESRRLDGCIFPAVPNGFDAKTDHRCDQRRCPRLSPTCPLYSSRNCAS